MNNISNHQEDRHLADLEYLDSISSQNPKILSNVTTRRSQKLHSLEIMDVRFGRSTRQIILILF